MFKKLKKSNSKIIGIFSDTHKKINRSKKVVDLLDSNGAEFFIHAGDIVKEEMLLQLEATKKPYVAVYGNNDAHLFELHNSYNLVQEPHYFKVADTKFKLMHLPFYMSADTEVVIFGHTHTFECDFKNGTLYLNPGESCARNKPISECALLEITDKKFKVTYFYRHLGEDDFKERHYTFERENSEN